MSHTVRVPGRAAVAGNPSDGFGGAVCSVVLPFFEASASIVDGPGDTFELVTATIARFSTSVAPVPDIGLSVNTTIPRSVGLAGSSAIVIAGLRSLDAYAGTNLDTSEIAELAHTVERVDLGIAGGWQDQIIQSHGVSGLMEFDGTPRLGPLDLGEHDPVPLYLAWSTAAAEGSGSAHSSLRQNRTAADPKMHELAMLGRAAAVAFAERNVHDLKASIDATFDIRRTIMAIAPLQEQMVMTARSLGASANFAGSGGAILGVLPKDGDEFLDAMRAENYEVATWNAR